VRVGRLPRTVSQMKVSQRTEEMGKILLITGGCRSGKSAFALRYAEKNYDRKIYLATAEALDGEMRERIEKHRQKRGPAWRTLEEPLEIEKVFESYGESADVILLDCVTLWISNLMMKNLDADKILSHAEKALDSIIASPSDVILVSNEVGWGIVPENKLARDFRDIAGRVNQKIASAAESVIILVSGIPMCIKGDLNANEC